MRIDYRSRLDDGQVLAVTLTVSDEKWEQGLQWCWDYFCKDKPPLPTLQPQVPLEALMARKGRRGSSR